MATNTGGDLNLVKPELTDNVENTIPALASNMQKIDDGVSAHSAETVSQGVHGMGSIASKVYEEGIWTPTLIGNVVAGNNTYSIRIGEYTRIGDMVHITCRLDLSSLDSAGSGVAQITGLPFPIKNNNLIYISSLKLSGATLGTGFTESVIRLLANTNYASIVTKGSEQNLSSLNVNGLSSNSQIRFSAFYEL